ncbi:Heavy-metal-associated domain protein [compost metagenome]
MYEFKVQGLTCKNCVKSLKEAIHSIDPKADLEVNLPAQTIKVQNAIDLKSIEGVIEKEGYPIIERRQLA